MCLLLRAFSKRDRAIPTKPLHPRAGRQVKPLPSSSSNWRPSGRSGPQSALHSLYVYAYTYVCMCVYIYTHMCIYTYGKVCVSLPLPPSLSLFVHCLLGRKRFNAWGVESMRPGVESIRLGGCRVCKCLVCSLKFVFVTLGVYSTLWLQVYTQS